MQKEFYALCRNLLYRLHESIAAGYDLLCRCRRYNIQEKRSSKYVDIIKTFDIESHNISQAKINEIINDTKNEFPELSIDDLPIGIVAKCYLGQPYEMHSLSLIGNVIIKHYKIQESLPADPGKARVLANNDRYAFVEVYKIKEIAYKTIVSGEDSLSDDLVISNFENVVPLSKTNPEKMELIRSWGRCLLDILLLLLCHP